MYACTKILMEESKGLGHMSLKGSTRDFFLFDIRFLSNKAAEAAAPIGVDLIGTVKANTKRFCKPTIEGLIKYWNGGSYIVLRRNLMMIGESPLLAIGY